jgi:hypothetical protein
MCRFLMTCLLVCLSPCLLVSTSTAQPLRVNVQSLGVLPGQEASKNDAILARYVAAIPDLRDKSQTLDLVFPADKRDYLISRPINPDRGGLRLVGDGPGSRLVMTGRADPVVMLGFGKRPDGKALTADHAFPLGRKLDATVGGSRWGFRTRNDCHLSQVAGPFSAAPYADLRRLTMEYAYDSSVAGEHSAPIAGIDGVWELIDGPTWLLWFWTADAPGSPPTRNDLSFAGPKTPGVHRITLQFDFDARTMTPYVDGVQVKVVGEWKAPVPPAGSKTHFAANQAKPFGLGGVAPVASRHGNDWWGRDQNYDRAICGFALYSRARYADDGPGRPQRRLDGRPINDRLRYFDGDATDLIGLLDLTDPPTGERYADRLLTVLGPPGSMIRNSSAFVMAREHERIGLFPFGIERMVLEGPGDCVAIGAALTLDFRDSAFKAGPSGRAIGSWNFGASYFNRVRDCSLSGGEAAFYAFYGMWDLENLNIGIHGRNTFWAVNSSVAIRRVFMGDGGTPERVFYAVGCPRLLIDDVEVDIENGKFPTTAIIEARSSIAMGAYVEQIKIRDLSVGGVKIGIPLVKLGVLEGHPQLPARFDLSGLSIGAAPKLLDTFVRVESPNWSGRLDVDYEHKTPIKATFAGECKVKRVGPAAPSP